MQLLSPDMVKESVTKACTVTSSCKAQYFSGILSVDNMEWICTTCKNSIMSGVVKSINYLLQMR